MTPDTLDGSNTATSGNDALDIPPDAFASIMEVLKEKRGFNLEIYKEKCIKRRIVARIRRTCFSCATQYASYLRREPAEIDHLMRVLTIHVSQFYRNPSTFRKLHEEILPQLLAHERQEFRIWSVGCSSGEEPYSLALILKRYFPERLRDRRVALLATDVDAEIIEAAKAGIYREERVVEVPQEEKDRWFVQQGNNFKLAQEIKDMVTFRQSDLSDVTDFPGSDLILCRNVLIYLERDHQEKVLQGFADALCPRGMLVLGKAETLVGRSRQRFQTVCPIERIYQAIP